MTVSPASTVTTAQLLPAVRAAAVHDDLVLLDIARDAYFCLRGAAATLRLEVKTGVLGGSVNVIAELRDAGLVASPDGQAPPRATPPPLPTASAVPTQSETLRISDLVPTTVAVADILLTYRGNGFQKLIRRVAARRADPPDGNPSTALLDEVRAFHRWAPYAPVSGKCLLRSYMLLRALHRAGHDAAWVFGVSTWPFRAHCWLQRGDVALDDSVERLTDYHAILVV